MIITIDGLSATGKSTVAKRLAHTLHYLYFNTGLVYRMVTYVILKNHLTDPKMIVDSLNQLDFELESDQIIMNHQNITDILYTDEIVYLHPSILVFWKSKNGFGLFKKSI